MPSKGFAPPKAIAITQEEILAHLSKFEFTEAGTHPDKWIGKSGIGAAVLELMRDGDRILEVTLVLTTPIDSTAIAIHNATMALELISLLCPSLNKPADWLAGKGKSRVADGLRVSKNPVQGMTFINFKAA